MSEVTVRRIVTGHDREGRAVFLSDERVAADHLVLPLAKGDQETDVVSVWSTPAVPADNSGDAPSVEGLAAGAADGQVFDAGVKLRVVQLPPGSSAPLHRTHSVDYGILLEGECDLELDDGATTRLHAGDVVIQRGTNHSWINRGDAPCRWAWILLAAEPVRIAGEALPAAWAEAPEL